jgi:putative transposase
VRRTFVFKLEPTAAQAAGLERYLEVTRRLYNAALEQRIAVYRGCGESRGWRAQSREIRDVREAGMLEGCHVHAAQTALKRLDLAYNAFFRRLRAGVRRNGFPRFKAARHWRSVQFKEWGNGVSLDADARRLKISGVGSVRVRLHRPLQGVPKTCALVKKADGWYAHIVCDLGAAPVVVDPELVPESGRVAFDLGVESLATLDDGSAIENPRHLRHAARKLRHEQKALARCQRGSRRRERQRERVARAHLKLARARRDFHHKRALALAERYTAVAVEDLTVTAMVASAKGTIDKPGRGVRQKAGLNRSILDAGWSQFLTVLGEKLEARGGVLVRVDPRGTSQECSRCGTRVPKALSERCHECPACGLSMHRDHNAAINIYHRAWAVPVAEAA